MKANKKIPGIIICVLISVIVILLTFNCNRNTDMTSDENYIIDTTTTLSTNIRFSYEYVSSIILNNVDSSYHIKYDDPDAFDYDNLAHYAGVNEWYGNYIFVHIDKPIVTAFLHDYIVYTSDVNYDTKKALNKKYCINEVELIDSNNISNFIWTIKMR